MTRPTEKLKPIGFFSYARQDDEKADGRLSQLRFLLANELQISYGKQPIRIFQDVAAIPPGDDWEKAINDAINHATFFIPIITRAFVESEWCSKEVSNFIVREAAINAAHPELKGKSRIFPILYTDIDNVQPHDPEAFAALRRIQFMD
ncbi:MAG: toll/interleukin-1 receptor domain-containing protein, partial [Sandarakinorhabdus sp.]